MRPVEDAVGKAFPAEIWNPILWNTGWATINEQLPLQLTDRQVGRVRPLQAANLQKPAHITHACSSICLNQSKSPLRLIRKLCRAETNAQGIQGGQNVTMHEDKAVRNDVGFDNLFARKQCIRKFDCLPL